MFGGFVVDFRLLSEIYKKCHVDISMSLPGGLTFEKGLNKERFIFGRTCAFAKCLGFYLGRTSFSCN